MLYEVITGLGVGFIEPEGGLEIAEHGLHPPAGPIQIEEALGGVVLRNNFV